MKVVSFTASAGLPVRKLHQSRDIIKDSLPPVVAQPAEVNRVHLLAAILGNVTLAVKAVVLVGKFLTRQDHRNADGSQKADEGELYAPLDVIDTGAAKKLNRRSLR